MWAMYAQSWNDGVMIAIPLNKFKDWVKGSNIICCADKTMKKAITSRELKKDHLSASRVAYALKEENGVVLSTGSVKNSNFKKVNTSLLSGYIKDDAWSYEKELRLRVDTEEDNEFGAVAVKIPDDVINSMMITKDPRFKGDLTERIHEAIDLKIKTDKSLFYEKLNYVPCDNCKTVEELTRKLKEVTNIELKLV